MAPKKAAVRAPQENISLGPQVREGKNALYPTVMRRANAIIPFNGRRKRT
jgi:hypothetical protein